MDKVAELDILEEEILLIQMPIDRGKKRKHDEAAGVPSRVKRLIIQIGSSGPSEYSLPSLFQRHVGPGGLINCNRPFEFNTLPITLLHEAFAIFKDRCETAPSEQALACLNELTPMVCEWYTTRLGRREAIQSLFGELFNIHLHAEKVPGTEFTTDGNLAVIIMPAVIRVCENEAGNALNKAILLYSKFLSGALDHHLHFYNFDTCFPCILMIDMGSTLGLYAAAWDGVRVKIEPLTQGIDLTTHWRERNARYAIASRLDALLVAVHNIRSHYESIEAKAKANPARSGYDDRVQKARRHPFLTSYQDDGRKISFSYDVQLDVNKLVFSAIVNKPDSGECIVKFPWQYSEAAHNYLADRGFAPKIRQVVRISADWTAVIMDVSEYQILYGSCLSKVEREKVQHKIENTVRILHEGGFVHGDIRDHNILVDRASLESDDVVVQLIDFDWAGRVGEARYPIGVNCDTVWRPKGVKGGGLITEEHDNQMVSYLCRP